MTWPSRELKGTGMRGVAGEAAGLHHEGDCKGVWACAEAREEPVKACKRGYMIPFLKPKETCCG